MLVLPADDPQAVRATELAPFDLSLWLDLATYQIESGDLRAARGSLVPVAYDPHGGGTADAARQVIERIDAGGEPAATDLVALLRAAATDEDEGQGTE